MSLHPLRFPAEKEQEPKLTCEYCGWVDFAYTFKGSKRFCSVVCAKRQVIILVVSLLFFFCGGLKSQLVDFSGQVQRGLHKADGPFPSRQEQASESLA